MGDWRGQKEGAGARYDPKKKNNFPIFREGKVPHHKGSKEHEGHPYRSELFNAAVKPWRNFSEGMNGVDESGQSCVFTDRHHLA